MVSLLPMDATSSQGNQDKSVIAKVQNGLSVLKQTSFALFAAVNLNNASNIGPKFFSLGLLVQTLQWLWFALSTSAAFPWTSAYISWLRAISKVARFDLFITDEETVTVPLAVPIVLLVGNLLLYGAAFLISIQLYKITNNTKTRHHESSSASSSLFSRDVSGADDEESNTIHAFANRSVLLHLFTTVMNWTTSFLFLPVSALLIGTIRCSKSETRCFAGSHLASAVMGMITLALWLPLCFLYVAFKFPRSIHIATMGEEHTASLSSSASTASYGGSSGVKSFGSTNITADYADRAHNRLALLKMLAALAVMIAFELATAQNSVTQWGLAGGFIAIVFFNLAASLWYLPFINRHTQALDVASSTLLTWTGLCLIIALLYNDEQQVVASVLLLLGAPLVVALTQFFLAKRRDSLAHQPIATVEDSMLIEVHLRLAHELKQDLSLDKLPSQDLTNSSDKQSTSDGASLARECLRLCRSSGSTSLLCLQLARMCSSLPAARQRIAMLLQLAATRDPALDVQFGLYCLQQSLDESLGQDMKDLSVQRYLRFQALSTAASQQVIVAARCQKAFFGELASNEPNVERMTAEGVLLNRALTLANQQFEQALHLYRSPRVMRQYGSFLLTLLNDQSGQTVLHQADQLDRVLQAKGRTSSSSSKNMLKDEIFREDTAVLSVSCANEKQFGVITSANQGACSMFGCAAGDLVGAPISSVVPSPFNAMHDGFLHGYLEADRSSSFMSKTQHVFACRRNGTIFPVALLVRQVSGGLQGSAFVAVVAEVKSLSTEHFLLYEASSRRVRAVSAGCAAVLGVDAHSVGQAKSTVTVDQLIPSLKPQDEVSDPADDRVQERPDAAAETAETEKRVKLGKDATEFTVSEAAMKFQSIDVRVLKLAQCLNANIARSSNEYLSNQLQFDDGGDDAADGQAAQSDAGSDQDDAEPQPQDEDEKHDSTPQLHVLIEPPSPSQRARVQSALRHRAVDIDGKSTPRRSVMPHKTKSEHTKRGRMFADVNPAAQDDAHLRVEQRPEDALSGTEAADDVDLKPGREIAVSQAGSNTTNSSVGYNAALQSVRKLALSEEAPMEPSIKCLQRFIRFTFIVVLVMCVVGFVVVRSSGDGIRQSITNVHYAGELRSHIVDIRLALDPFLRANERLRAPLTNASIAAERANIRRAVERGFELHKQLYLQRSSLGADLERLYTSNELPMEIIVSGSVVATSVNLWDGVNRILSAASRLVETNVLEIINTQADVFAVQENTAYEDPLFDSIMKVIVLYQRQAERNTQLVIQTQAILMAAAIGVLMLIVLLVFPPVVRHVNQTVHRIFELFLDISPLQIIEIARSREEVLVTLGVGSESGAVETSGAMHSDFLAGGDMSTDPIKRQTKSVKNRRIVTSARRTLIIAGKVLLLFAGASAYFAASFSLEYTEFNHQYVQMGEQAYVARRNTLLGDAGLTSRDLLIVSQRQTIFRPTPFALAAEAAKDRMEQLTRYQQALLYGDASLRLYGSMRRNKDLDELNFGNACKYLPLDLVSSQNFGDFTERNCTTLGKGVFLSGLNAAVQLYIQSLSSVITAMRSFSSAPPSTSNSTSNSTGPPPSMPVSASDIATSTALLIWWLPAAFSVETSLYVQQQIQGLDHFVELRTTMLAVFISALAVCFLLMFEPLVYEMDTHVKRVRALLVMIPAEVAMSTASLRKALMSAL